MDEIDDAQKAERLYRQEALDNRTPVGRPDGKPDPLHRLRGTDTRKTKTGN
jgi:hypothetical protein